MESSEEMDFGGHKSGTRELLLLLFSFRRGWVQGLIFQEYCREGGESQTVTIKTAIHTSLDGHLLFGWIEYILWHDEQEYRLDSYALLRNCYS